jgi:hypothetical protein
MPCTTVNSSLENGMFNKMGKAMMAVTLVTAAGIHGKTAPSHLASGGHVHQAQTIGEGMIIYSHFFCFLFLGFNRPWLSHGTANRFIF